MPCVTVNIKGSGPTVTLVDYGFGETKWRNSYFTECTQPIDNVKNYKEAIGVTFSLANTGFWGSVKVEAGASYSTPNAFEPIVLRKKQSFTRDGQHTIWLEHPTFYYIVGNYEIYDAGVNITE